MATTSTPNLGLVKPTPGTGEYADVSVINGNMDAIDAAVGNPGNKGSLQSQVDALASDLNGEATSATVLDGLVIIRQGNMRTLTGYVSSVAIDNSGTVIATLSASDCPPINLSTILAKFNGNLINGLIGNNGGIKMYAQTATARLDVPPIVWKVG